LAPGAAGGPPGGAATGGGRGSVHTHQLRNAASCSDTQQPRSVKVARLRARIWGTTGQSRVNSGQEEYTAREAEESRSPLERRSPSHHGHQRYFGGARAGAGRPHSAPGPLAGAAAPTIRLTRAARRPAREAKPLTGRARQPEPRPPWMARGHTSIGWGATQSNLFGAGLDVCGYAPADGGRGPGG
jgi:hypothetical protein